MPPASSSLSSSAPSATATWPMADAAIGHRLQGRIAIVTGAGSVGPGWGNGRAIAVRFAREGAHVVAVDRELAALEDTLALAGDAADRIEPVRCDVTRADEIEALVADCVARHGGLDVLVNNVGAPIPGGPVRLSEADWDLQIDVDLKSVFLGCKYAIPAMEARGGGSIVNIASTSGIRFTGAAQVAYAAAKAGIIQLSRVVAVEYAPKRIRVNSVVPGQLHTPLVDAFLAGQQTGGDIDSLLARRAARIPLALAGDGRDTAAAALYLASDDARFVTGTEIIVDGGMSARCD